MICEHNLDVRVRKRKPIRTEGRPEGEEENDWPGGQQDKAMWNDNDAAVMSCMPRLKLKSLASRPSLRHVHRPDSSYATPWVFPYNKCWYMYACKNMGMVRAQGNKFENEA